MLLWACSSRYACSLQKAIKIVRLEEDRWRLFVNLKTTKKHTVLLSARCFKQVCTQCWVKLANNFIFICDGYCWRICRVQQSVWWKELKLSHTCEVLLHFISRWGTSDAHDHNNCIHHKVIRHLVAFLDIQQQE